MLRYECDNCQKLKGKNEEWILGFAAENIGVKAARHDVVQQAVRQRQHGHALMVSHEAFHDRGAPSLYSPLSPCSGGKRRG